MGVGRVPEQRARERLGDDSGDGWNGARRRGGRLGAATGRRGRRQGGCDEPTTGHSKHHDGLLEGRTHGELERERLGRPERVGEHAIALRVRREDQAERHVEDRHEEPDLGARRGLERVAVADDIGDRRRLRRGRIRQRGDARRVVEERRRRQRRHRLIDRFLPGEVLVWHSKSQLIFY